MDILEEHYICTFIVQCCTLKVEVLSSCEMLLPQLRLHGVNPEDRNMNHHHHENLKSQKLLRLIKEMNWQYEHCDELVK